MELSYELQTEDLHALLERLHDKYNCPEFIENDPISVPHAFTSREDREVAGLFASTIAWGNRKAIVKSARRMMHYMDDAPYDFVCNASQKELERLYDYVHRTFNGEDFADFVVAVKGLCERFGGIGKFVEERYLETKSMEKVLSDFRREFFSCKHNSHCEKHISSIDKGAACKRLNMYFRWFVRRDNRGVDFGEWNTIPMSALYLPLDVHTGNMGRALGLLRRKQSDWKATVEITDALRRFDPEDPVRYDFSLFGAGIDGFLKQ